MKQIVFIGASGHGKVCADIAKLNGYDEIIFLDDELNVKKCGDYQVQGTSGDYKNYLDDAVFFISIGNADSRKRIQENIETAGGMLTTLIHPSSVVSSDVPIGIGTVVMPGVVINVGADIGKGCIINTSSSVDHDCTVGDYCHIAVGAHVCGTVNIGDKTWIGAGATVSNNTNICSDVVVGAGAVVISDIEEPGTYVGVPAKRVKSSTLDK